MSRRAPLLAADRRGALLGAALLVACQPAPRGPGGKGGLAGGGGDSGVDSGVDSGLDAASPTSGDGWVFSAAPVCAAPTEGFARLRERGVELGLRTPVRTSDAQGSCGVVPGVIVAADLDADGRDELVVNHGDAPPVLVVAVGASLEERPLDALAPPEGRTLLGLAAADVDGDGLADLIGVGEGFLVVALNDGAMGFGGWEPHLWQAEHPRDCFTGVGVGDIDSDGDLDVSLPGLDRVLTPGALMGSADVGWAGSVDRLLRNDGGRLVLDRTLPRGDGAPSFSLVHLITDRDNDGDQDLIAWSDRAPLGYPQGAAWRNDGLDADGRPVLVDDALTVNMPGDTSAMGLTAVDLNDDGLIDPCVSDMSYALDCRLSDPGGYYEGALLLGLFASGDEVAEELHASADAATADRDEEGLPRLDRWTTWGLVYVDLENDGHGDMAVVAGPPPDVGSVYRSDGSPWQPDWIWQGDSIGRFRTAVRETGFHSLAWAYGLAAVDLFGDGYRELVVGRVDGPPEVWDNPCGSGAWVEVRLEGAAGNRDGVGAQVELWAGGRRHLQQVLAQTGVQQHSFALHFGLGEARQVDALTVRWPDGPADTYAGPVPVNGVLRLRRRER